MEVIQLVENESIKKKQAMIRNLTELQSYNGDALVELRILVEIILEKVMSHKSLNENYLNPHAVRRLRVDHSDEVS